MTALDDANAASQLRHDLNAARRDLDAALAVIGTLSSHLAEAEHKARIARRAHETAVNALARTREIRAQHEPGGSPSGEVKTPAVVSDMKVAAFTQSVIMDGVVENFTIEVRQQARHAGITYKVTELNIDEVAVDPRIASLSTRGLAAEHEHDALVEHVLDFQVRLVADREGNVPNDELAAEVSHGAPSQSGGDDATPAVDVSALAARVSRLENHVGDGHPTSMREVVEDHLGRSLPAQAGDLSLEGLNVKIASLDEYTFDLEAEAQACAERLARNQAVHDRAREILAGSHVAFDAADGAVDRGESLLDPVERIEDRTRNVDEIPNRFFGGHDDSSAPGRPDSARGTNVEAGARGGQVPGPRVDAPKGGAA